MGFIRYILQFSHSGLSGFPLIFEPGHMEVRTKTIHEVRGTLGGPWKRASSFRKLGSLRESLESLQSWVPLPWGPLQDSLKKYLITPTALQQEEQHPSGSCKAQRPNCVCVATKGHTPPAKDQKQCSHGAQYGFIKI